MAASRLSYRLLYAANFLVGGTGLVYAWMRYLAESDDPFAIVNHPWQPHLQHLHVLTAPLLVLMLGHFWAHHALSHWRWKVKEGRRSGLAAWLTILPMVCSGYFIQISVSDLWRNIWIGIHLAASALWLLALAGHWFSHRRRIWAARTG